MATINVIGSVYPMCLSSYYSLLTTVGSKSMNIVRNPQNADVEVILHALMCYVKHHIFDFATTS